MDQLDPSNPTYHAVQQKRIIHEINAQIDSKTSQTRYKKHPRGQVVGGMVEDTKYTYVYIYIYIYVYEGL